MAKKVDLTKIKLLVLDVDGVLTDGSVVINGDGSESKAFNVYDGHGIRLWQRAGLLTAFLSGRFSEPTNIRARQLEIGHVYQDCKKKMPYLKELLEKTDLKPENAAYIGDDLMDVGPVSYVGFGAAVANASEELKKRADFITQKPGGSGAVREVIEYILKETGRWPELMERYLQVDRT